MGDKSHGGGVTWRTKRTEMITELIKNTEKNDTAGTTRKEQSSAEIKKEHGGRSPYTPLGNYKNGETSSAK